MWLTPGHAWKKNDTVIYRETGIILKNTVIYIFDHTTQNYSAGVKTWIKGNTPQTSQTHRMQSVDMIVL